MATPNYHIVLPQNRWTELHAEDLAVPIGRAENDPRIRADPLTRTIEIDYAYGDLNNVHRVFRQMIGGNRKSWAEEYGTDAFKAEELTRIEEARDALREHEGPEDDPNDATGIDAPAPVAGALTGVLADAPGVCLGHSHNQAAAYQFLADAVANPGNFGLDGGMLFVEELPAAFQGEIDAFLDSDPANAWSDAAQSFFDRIAQDRALAGTTRLDAILEGARVNNIKVFAIDSGEMSPALCANASYPEQRCANMNAFGKQVMDAAIEANPERKYVAFCGSAHSNTHEGGVPGFSQIYDIPALRLADNGTVTRDDEDRTKRGMPGKAVQQFVDRYLLVLEATQRVAPSPDNPSAAVMKAQALQVGQALALQGDLPDFGALDEMEDEGERALQKQALLDQMDVLVGQQPAAGPWQPYVAPPPPPPPPSQVSVWFNWLVDLVDAYSG